MRFTINCEPRHLSEVTECVRDMLEKDHAMCGYMVAQLKPPYLIVSVRKTKAGMVAHAYDQTEDKSHNA